ncbi:MAG: hypothetical protein GY934_03790 [Gammaproteobacteria bacterium]|nr:hypothetical protein [Gammaproteobacteria bacterium]
MSLTGNNDKGNPAAGRSGGVATAIPELEYPLDIVYPGIAWGDADVAHLQVRLEMFDDLIVLSKFRDGHRFEHFVVDPEQLAIVLGGLSLGSTLLPKDCLFWGKWKGTDRLGVYVPPQVWSVRVRGNAQQGWRVPLPGLVFVGHEGNYWLWAVKERPTSSETPLYVAPVPNVSGKGVCQGNVYFPQAGCSTIWAAVDAFFSSRFNRDLSQGKSLAHPDCVVEQWQALQANQTQIYPLADLVEAGGNLGAILNAQD